MSITHTELRALLEAEGFRGERILLYDTHYSLPAPGYITGLGERFKRFLRSAGVRYRDLAFDCNAFSHLAVAVAKLDHGVMGDLDTAIAIGMCSLVYDSISHTCIVAVLRENGVNKVRYYEPQPTTAANGLSLKCLNEKDPSLIELRLACSF